MTVGNTLNENAEHMVILTAKITVPGVRLLLFAKCQLASDT